MLYELLINSEEFIHLLHLCVIILLHLSFLLFLIKAIKLDVKSQKNVFFGYSLFCLFFGFTRLFFLLSWFCGENEACTNLFLIFGYLIGTLGIMIYIFILETYLLKTKKILTVINIIVFLIILIALFGLTSRAIALTIIYISSPSVIIAFLITYIYLIIKSSGLSRKKAIGALIGLLGIFIGHSMNTGAFFSLFPGVPTFISPIVLIIGVIIFTTTQLLIK